MKRLFLIIVCLCTLTAVSAQAPQKPQNLLGKSVQYLGEVVRKVPTGEGVLTIKSVDKSGEYSYVLSGAFDGTTVTGGEFKMVSQGVTFKGDVTYAVDKKLKSVVVTLSNGEFTSNGMTVAKLRNEQLAVTIPTKGTAISGNCQVAVEYELDEANVELAKRFAGSDSFTNFGGYITLTVNTANGLEVAGRNDIKSATMSFDNGAVVTVAADNSSWKRANGDVIEVENGAVKSFSLAIAEGEISNENIRYSFDNGNQYVGTYKNLAPSTLEELIVLNSIAWSWENAADNIVSGTVTYANGNTIIADSAEVVDFVLNFENGNISPNNIVYTFPNGAKYEGSYRNLVPESLAELLIFSSLDWAWDDTVTDYIVTGTLYYANGNTILFESSEIKGFDMAFEAGRITPENIIYTFPCGVKYEGGYNKNLTDTIAASLVAMDNFVWPLDKFDEWISAGQLTFTDGNVVQVAHGQSPQVRADLEFNGGIYRSGTGTYSYSGVDGSTVSAHMLLALTNDMLVSLDKLVTRENVMHVPGTGELRLANGEYFKFEVGSLSEYLVIYDKGTIKNGIISHTFENGNKFEGSVRRLFSSGDFILNFKGSDWKWADINNHAYEGVLTMTNGARKTYVMGYDEVAFAKQKKMWEQAKKKDVLTFFNDYWRGKQYKTMRVTYLDLSYVTYRKDDEKMEVHYSNGDVLSISNVTPSQAQEFHETFNPEEVMVPDIYDAYWDKAVRFYKDGLVTADGEVHIPTKNGRVIYVYYDNINSYRITSLDYVKDGITYTQKYVRFKDGKLFDGEYSVVTDNTIANAYNDDVRIKALGIKLCGGPEAIKSVEFINGALFDETGKVLEIYQDGTLLDAAETLRVASEYTKKREHRETIERYKSKGYEEEHVQAVLDGKIPVGAPIKLLIEYHGGDKIKYSGYYDDTYELKSYTGFGKYIAVDSNGIITETRSAY
ncbi:MAG: hypothetical protein J6R01_02280 [Alistipes sp.]|nr:hypothetical protein [Alistipes sp.]